MKKVIFALAIAFMGVMASCGHRGEATETLGAAVDSTEVVEDSVVAPVDTVVETPVDTVVAE